MHSRVLNFPSLLLLLSVLSVSAALIPDVTSQHQQKQKQRYEPTWDSLDSRPLPGWYDDVKLGIFIVWGVYSVPSFSSEWFWHSLRSGQKDVVEFMKKNYPPGFTYPDFAEQFRAEFYEPDTWADIIEASGAK